MTELAAPKYNQQIFDLPIGGVTDIELSIEVVGDSAVSETSDLEMWLNRARIREIESVEQQSEPPGPGEQGPTLLAVLSVVLSSTALVKLAESVHVWITASRRSVKITIKDGDKEIVIDAQNPKDVTEVAEAMKQLQV